MSIDDKIYAVKAELCNLRHEFDGAAFYNPDALPMIRKAKIRREKELIILLHKKRKGEC